MDALLYVALESWQKIKIPLEKSPPRQKKISLWPVIICFCKVMMKRSMIFNSDRLENSLITSQTSGKLEFMDLPIGILFFQRRPGILHPPSCMEYNMK